MREIDSSVYTTGEINYQFPTDYERDKAIPLAMSHLIEDGAVITQTTAEGIDLQGTAFMKGINPVTKQIEGKDWYSGFYRISTNEKSVARFYLSSGTEKTLKHLSKQIRSICEKELCGIKIE